MAKRRYHTAFRTAYQIGTKLQTARNIGNMLRHKRRRRGDHTKTTIDKEMQSTSMEVARNFQVTNVKKFSKAKPQTKDFFELYNLQTGITQSAGNLATLQGRQSFYGSNYFMQYEDIMNLTDAFNGTNDHGRIFFQSCEIETMCTNQSNWQIIIDIYDCMATGDVKASITTAWQTAAGVSSGGIGMGEAATTPTIIGVKPSDLPAFTNQWRPFKHNRVYLNPGEVWIHKIFRYINKKFPVQELITSFSTSGSNNYIPGLTSASLLLLRGVPVHDNTHNPTTSGAQEIALTQSNRMRYAVIPESVSGDLLQSNTLFPTTLTNLYKMETETDAVGMLKNA